MSTFVPRVLQTTLDRAWDTLIGGVRELKHGFHTPTLCTVDRDGVPQGRIVVLRGADRTLRRLTFHTDVRASKVEQLEAQVSWVFYDASSKLQIRARGPTLPRTTAREDERWQASPPTSRKCYLVEPGPGTPVPAWTTGLPQDLLGASVPTMGRSEAGRRHFRAVDTEVIWLESLYLSRHGHERARFEWRNETWEGTWVVP